MNFVISLLIKLFWWSLPRMLGFGISKLSDALELVEIAETRMTDSAERRAWALAGLGGTGNLPEPLIRLIFELCVILHGLGVTTPKLMDMELIVERLQATDFTDEDKRRSTIEQFGALYPDVPERAARLILEVAVAKLKARLT